MALFGGILNLTDNMKTLIYLMSLSGKTGGFFIELRCKIIQMTKKHYTKNNINWISVVVIILLLFMILTGFQSEFLQFIFRLTRYW